MKLLILGLNFAPELTGIGKYTWEMAEWLTARGHDVRVVTAPPYYPAWRVADGYSAWKYMHETMKGVDVWRCPLYVPEKQSGLRRILHLASFAVSSLPLMVRQLFWKPDVVFVVEPPLFCAPAAWLGSRLAGARCWLHIQDFEVDAAFELGLLPPGRLRRFVSAVERWLMRRFDRVSTISHRMIEKLNDKGVPKARQVYFPNWVGISQIHPLERASRYRRELGIDEQCVVALYSGNMGEKQGLEVVIEAAECLKDDRTIQFVLCGEGASHARMQQMARNLANVHWLPLQPVEKLNELLNLADIHLLPQRTDAADLVMPSKLTGMLASGRPVIATVNEGTQIAEVIQGAGVVVPPGDSEALAAALKDLSNDPELRRKMGEAGRNHAINHLSLDAVLSKFEQDLKVCVG